MRCDRRPGRRLLRTALGRHVAPRALRRSAGAASEPALGDAALASATAAEELLHHWPSNRQRQRLATTRQRQRQRLDGTTCATAPPPRAAQQAPASSSPAPFSRPVCLLHMLRPRALRRRLPDAMPPPVLHRVHRPVARARRAAGVPRVPGAGAARQAGAAEGGQPHHAPHAGEDKGAALVGEKGWGPPAHGAGACVPLPAVPPAAQAPGAAAAIAWAASARQRGPAPAARRPPPRLRR